MKPLGQYASPRHVARLGVAGGLHDGAVERGADLRRRPEQARELASSKTSQSTHHPCRGPFPCDSC